MKKVVSIILFIILIIVSINVQAVSENGSTVNMNFTQTVNDDSVVVTMRLGDFVSVAEDSVMSVEMTFDYDENLISEVKGISGNNWDINIQKETKRILLETDTAKPNTEVAQITFEIKPQTQVAQGTVTLKGIIVGASNSGLNETYDDVTVNFTANPETPENPEQNETAEGNTTNEVGNNITNNTNSTSDRNNTSTNNSSNKTNSIAGNKDNTTAGTRLPDTGIRNILIIAIVIVAICIVIFKIKSRKIKY